MLLNSHISVYTRCVAEKVCGLVWSTWGTSQSEDKLWARDRAGTRNHPEPTRKYQEDQGFVEI